MRDIHELGHQRQVTVFVVPHLVHQAAYQGICDDEVIHQGPEIPGLYPLLPASSIGIAEPDFLRHFIQEQVFMRDERFHATVFFVADEMKGNAFFGLFPIGRIPGGQALAYIYVIPDIRPLFGECCPGA